MFTQAALVSEMPSLRRFAMRLTADTAEADDLVQSTLLRALEKQDLFQEGTNLFSWTSRIMFNLFVSRYRRRTKFESRFDPEPYIHQMETGPGQEAATDLAIVRDAMMKLTREHRDILVYVCVKGMKYEEVSEMLQIPVGTVRSRLSRARRQLQDMLEARRRKDWFALPGVQNDRLPSPGKSVA